MDEGAQEWGGLFRRLVPFGSTIRAVKLGPSAMGILGTLGAFGLLASVATGWIFNGQPLFATGLSGLLLLFTFAVILLIVRFAEKNPITAVLGGSELVRLFEGQVGAKNEGIVLDQKPTVGGAQAALEGADDVP